MKRFALNLKLQEWNVEEFVEVVETEAGAHRSLGVANRRAETASINILYI